MIAKGRKRKKGCCGCLPIAGLFALAIVVCCFFTYNAVLNDNIIGDEEVSVTIPPDATIDMVVDSLVKNNIINSENSFRQVAKLKRYKQSIRPGQFKIQPNWNNNELINHLRSGSQKAVKFVIHNARTRKDLAGIVGKQLSIDSLLFLQSLNDGQVADQYGFTKDNFPTMFLANTYELYWNTSEEQFINRMKKEYDRFWNEERKKKAAQLGLTTEEVIILSSIVEEETKQNSELKTVAGLYLNRLERGIALQADPTVKYAVGDFALKRILNKHLEFDSPYNTYKYAGLPPGPIRIPELNVVDAVLNPKDHDFLYMCAKPDYSGEHNFAKTLAEHNRNANIYHEFLNKENIK